MPYRADDFIAGNYYHIFNRGASKQLLFFNQGNYEYLQRLIDRYSTKYGVTIIAYCLMPNHYHMLCRQETDQPLSKFINVLFLTYALAVNRQQGRTGTLFEGRFRHVHIDRYEYLIHLCRYIHNNPRKAGLVTYLQDWPYSNYLDWVGLRNSKLKDEEFVNYYFPEVVSSYPRFLDDWKNEEREMEKVAKYILD